MTKVKRYQKKKAAKVKIRCGLCGKTGKIYYTPCCNNPICDDEDKYELFSYARNSCSRNHRRFTLCSFHFNEGHKGDWKTCQECKNNLHPEMYDWYGSNEYNFDKLDDLLPFTPIRCGICRSMIFQSQESYAALPDGTYRCERCGKISKT